MAVASGRGGLNRILGLGFVFGAKDTGASKTAKTLRGAFDGLTESVERTSKSSQGIAKFGNAINALNFLQLRNISGTLGDLAQKAGVGAGQMGEQIETFGVEAANTYRIATAGLGTYSKEVDKYRSQITGVSYELGTDVEALTGVVTGIVKSGRKVEAYGVQIREFAGLLKAGIIDESFSKTLTSLDKSYDMGEAGAKSYLDMITKFGEGFGVGADAVKELPNVIKAADPILAQFTNLDFKGLSLSMYRLAAASQKTIGGTFAENMEMATTVFSKLGEQREQMAQLVTGLQSDFPEMAKELGIATGDVGSAMEAIMSDPLTFAQNVSRMLQDTKGSPRALRLLAGTLKDLGPDFSFFVTKGDAATQAMKEASAEITEYGGAFNAMAKKQAKTSRTLAESQERIKQAFEMRVRRIGMSAKDEGEALNIQRKIWKKWGDQIEKTASDKGPLGAITRAALRFRQMGWSGLLQGIDDMEKRGGFLGKLAGWIKKSAPLLDVLTNNIGDFAAMVTGPLVAAWLGLKGFKTVLPMLTGVVGALGAGPVLAFAAAGLVAYKNWDMVGPALGEAWEGVKRVAGSATDASLAFTRAEDSARGFGDQAVTSTDEASEAASFWVELWEDTFPTAMGVATTGFLGSMNTIRALLRGVGMAMGDLVVRGGAAFKRLGAYASAGFGHAIDKVLFSLEMFPKKLKGWSLDLKGVFLDLGLLMAQFVADLPEWATSKLGISRADIVQSIEYLSQKQGELGDERKKQEKEIAMLAAQQASIEQARDRERIESMDIATGEMRRLNAFYESENKRFEEETRRGWDAAATAGLLATGAASRSVQDRRIARAAREPEPTAEESLRARVVQKEREWGRKALANQLVETPLTRRMVEILERIDQGVRGSSQELAKELSKARPAGKRKAAPKAAVPEDDEMWQ